MSPLRNLVFLAAAAAAQSTFTYYVPGFDNQTVYGSVVASSQGSTTLVLACPTSDFAATGAVAATSTDAYGDTYDSDECGIYPGMTLTAGPDVAAYTITDDNTATVSCSMSGSVVGVCSYSDTPLTETDDSFQTTIQATAGTTTLTADYIGTLMVIQTDNVAALNSYATNYDSYPTSGSGSATAAGGFSVNSATLTATSSSGSASASSSGTVTGSSGTTAKATTGSASAASSTGASSSSSSAAAQSSSGARELGVSIAGVGLVAAVAALL